MQQTRNTQQTNKKPFYLGLGHSFQEIDSIDIAEWDIPLDGVITEKELRFFKH
jgi:5-formyltetrahydrofolate cyclo-ligase